MVQNWNISGLNTTAMKDPPVDIKIKIGVNVDEHLIVICGERINAKRFITIFLMKFAEKRKGNLGPFERDIKLDIALVHLVCTF